MAIGGMLNQSVGIETLHSSNYTGDPSYNASVSYPARVSYRQKKMYNRVGDEVVSTSHISVVYEVQYDDRITVDGISSLPLAIRSTYNQDGTYHHSGVDL